MGSHLNGVDSHNQTGFEPAVASHLNRSDSDAQDIENKGSDSNAGGSSNLFVSSSTTHLDEQDPNVLSFEDTHSHLAVVDAHKLSGSNPVSPPHPSEPNPGTQDVENFATHVHDVSFVGMSRFDSAVSHLSEAEEQAKQVSTSYECGMEKLDGSLCHDTFATPTSWRQHQLASVHMRPMPCPFCHSTTAWQPRSLLKHVQKHHQEKLWTNFRCQICSSGQPDSLQTLEAHVRKWYRDLSLQKRYDVTRGF